MRACVQECCGSMCLMHDDAVTLFYGYFTIFLLCLSACSRSFAWSLFFFLKRQKSLSVRWSEHGMVWHGIACHGIKPESFIFRSHIEIDSVPLCFHFMSHSLFLFTFSFLIRQKYCISVASVHSFDVISFRCHWIKTKAFENAMMFNSTA